MSFFNLYSAHIALPISDLITGRRIYYYSKFLAHSQFWSKSEIKEYQNTKLRELITHAYINVPFYSDLFKRCDLTPNDIVTAEDLIKLPILTKNDIRDGIRSGNLFDQTANKASLELNSSSGSTGEPLQFYLDKNSASFKKATSIRGWRWMSFELGDKILRISQIPRQGVLKKLQDYVSRSYYIHAYRLNDSEFDHIVSVLNKYKPMILRCYPEPLFLLANYIRRNNVRIQGLQAINTTGSTLIPQYREIIEDVFQCKIFDSFSCEGGAAVFECPTHDLYHSADEYAITEIVDSSGNPSQLGRLITTDLWNRATPFIRYDTQDVVEIATDECRCGRQLSTIKRIHGRSSDVLVTPSRQYLVVNNFTGLFQDITGIDQFQIHQTDLDSFVVLIKANYQFDKIAESRVMKIMNSIINEDVRIKITLVDEIPLPPTGKRRFLVRDNSIPLDVGEH